MNNTGGHEANEHTHFGGLFSAMFTEEKGGDLDDDDATGWMEFLLSQVDPAERAEVMALFVRAQKGLPVLGAVTR